MLPESQYKGSVPEIKKPHQVADVRVPGFSLYCKFLHRPQRTALHIHPEQA